MAMVTMRGASVKALLLIYLVQVEDRAASFGAVVGLTAPSIASWRIATGIRPPFTSATWGSALRGRIARRFYPLTLPRPARIGWLGGQGERAAYAADKVLVICNTS